MILKFKALDSPNEISYEEEYKKFKYMFNRKREFYYGNIYVHLGIYDDLLDETVNLLWRDFD